MLAIYNSPLKREVLFIKDTALTDIADLAAPQAINQGLVKGQIRIKGRLEY